MANDAKSAEEVKTQQNQEEAAAQTAQEIFNEIQTGKADFSNLNDDQRDVLVHSFNDKNKGVAHLTNERASKEYIDQCKADFEKYQGEYTSINYNICDKTKALDWAKWLKNWNETRVVAPANYWVGVLKFDEVITKIIEDLTKNPEESLDFDYGALTYTYNLMMGPMGVGIEYARWMADNQETYNAILEKLGSHIDMIALIKKKIGILQSRWAMACNGFVMEFDIDINDLENFRNIEASNM